MKWWGDLAARVLEDVLVFLAAVIGHVLSWPVVTLVIVLILLKPIRRLIGRMRTAKLWGSEAEFVAEELVAVTQAAVEDTAEAAEVLPSDDPEPEPEPETKRSEAREPGASYGVNEAGAKNAAMRRWLSRSNVTGRYSYSASRRSDHPYRHLYAGLDPVDTLLEAWVGFSPQLKRLHELFIGPVPASIGNYQLVEELGRVPEIPKSFLGAVRSLLSIRARVLNDDMDVSEGTALAYVNSAHRLNDLAEVMLTSPPDPDPDTPAP